MLIYIYECTAYRTMFMLYCAVLIFTLCHIHMYVVYIGPSHPEAHRRVLTASAWPGQRPALPRVRIRVLYVYTVYVYMMYI